MQQVVPDPTVLSRVWALVGAGDERSLYLSEDQGASFSVRHQWKRGTAWWRLHVHPTGKLYVSGPGSVGPFAIGISVDEGKTFMARDPVPDLADAQKTTTLVQVSVSLPRVSRNGHLFACGGGVDAGDAAYLAKSVDGVNWAAVATMSQVEPPATCMRSKCLETTSWLCLSYGVCPEALPNAGTGDAGGPPTSELSGCGCRFGGSSSQSGSLLALALALLIQRHSRLKGDEAKPSKRENGNAK